MRAMVLHQQKNSLVLVDIPKPQPSQNQLLIKVTACGICRTDLHIIDGELTSPRLPLVPGHQIVGTIEQLGASVSGFNIGDRVGVPWLGGTCGHCRYCQSSRENLCENPMFTGYQINGGLADYCIANANFCFLIPTQYSDIEAAPLLCAGLIGYRSLKKAGNAKRLGIYGFGAAAHILVQIAKAQHREIYAFTQTGDHIAQKFAMELGAKWAGNAEVSPPEWLDAAIIFAPAGELVPLALKSVDKGGTVVCGGIHMSDIPSFPYKILWGERCVCSVANLTREDGYEFMKLANTIPIKTETHVYPLERANEALDDLRHGRFTGAAVIKI